MADVVGEVESLTRKMPWWVIPLGGGGIVAIVLISRRSAAASGGSSAAPAEQTPSGGTDSTSTDSGWTAAYTSLVAAISDVTTNENAQATDVKSLKDSVQALADEVTKLTTPPPPAPPDNGGTVASNVTGSVHGPSEKHHIDSTDKAKHKKRQEKKGQVGHK